MAVEKSLIAMSMFDELEMFRLMLQGCLYKLSVNFFQFTYLVVVGGDVVIRESKISYNTGL